MSGQTESRPFGTSDDLAAGLHSSFLAPDFPSPVRIPRTETAIALTSDRRSRVALCWHSGHKVTGQATVAVAAGGCGTCAGDHLLHPANSLPSFPTPFPHR